MPLFRAKTNPIVLPRNSNGLGYSLNTLDNDAVGGSINISGGYFSDEYSTGGGNGGSIDLSGGGGGADSGGADGGSIQMKGAGGEDGGAGLAGSIFMNGATHGGSAGSINTSGAYDTVGGNIFTNGGADASGGSINTSNGGGSIDTTVGFIELGVSGFRTTLQGSAYDNNPILTLPNLTGTLSIALISASTALNFGSIGGGGGFLDLTITLNGANTSDVVFVTCLSGRGATDGKLIFEAFVSADNTVTVRAHNPTVLAIDPASYNFKVTIIKI